ncbi:hypothetical protein AVDCRST_MAG92-2950 [uncultured Coleofasciculus sp.]|uniref:Uncharacterized protein n=1 Tax=uncultured Coleofasciculus sp. TaxID=1267456 RepID=A0A6J4J5D7_9CYAN|nr:hypothetical protein AVDCRST_MAG92-2950 [uncultured Coleofasciculus sp.]
MSTARSVALHKNWHPASGYPDNMLTQVFPKGGFISDLK